MSQARFICHVWNSSCPWDELKSLSLAARWSRLKAANTSVSFVRRQQGEHTEAEVSVWLLVSTGVSFWHQALKDERLLTSFYNNHPKTKESWTFLHSHLTSNPPLNIYLKTERVEHNVRSREVLWERCRLSPRSHESAGFTQTRGVHVSSSAKGNKPNFKNTLKFMGIFLDTQTKNKTVPHVR